MIRERPVMIVVSMAVAVVAMLAAPRVRASQQTSSPGSQTLGPPPPTFKTGVDLVTVSVIVKNRDGRPVTGLARRDFELTDAGRVRDIADFRSEPAPISLAVLLDTSGSMHIDPKWTNARDAITRLAAELQPGRDRIALLTFDTQLHEVQPYNTNPGD